MWGCARSCTRMCVCRCARMFVRVYACMCARMYVCIYSCMHACMHACIGVCVHVCVGVCMHVCTQVCVWVRVCCVSVCLYVHTHTHTHVNASYWDQMNRALARRGQDNIEILTLGTGASMHIRTRQRHRPCSLRSTHGSTCQPAISLLCPALFLRPFSPSHDMAKYPDPRVAFWRDGGLPQLHCGCSVQRHYQPPATRGVPPSRAHEPLPCSS